MFFFLSFFRRTVEGGMLVFGNFVKKVEVVSSGWMGSDRIDKDTIFAFVFGEK